MPEYEVGIQRRKITDDALGKMVVKNNFDRVMIDYGILPLSDDSIRSLFKEFLKNSNGMSAEK